MKLKAIITANKLRRVLPIIPSLLSLLCSALLKLLFIPRLLSLFSLPFSHYSAISRCPRITSHSSFLCPRLYFESVFNSFYYSTGFLELHLSFLSICGEGKIRRSRFPTWKQGSIQRNLSSWIINYVMWQIKGSTLKKIWILTIFHFKCCCFPRLRNSWVKLISPASRQLLSPPVSSLPATRHQALSLHFCYRTHAVPHFISVIPCTAKPCSTFVFMNQPLALFRVIFLHEIK